MRGLHQDYDAISTRDNAVFPITGELAAACCRQRLVDRYCRKHLYCELSHRTDPRRQTF